MDTVREYAPLVTMVVAIIAIIIAIIRLYYYIIDRNSEAATFERHLPSALLSGGFVLGARRNNNPSITGSVVGVVQKFDAWEFDPGRLLDNKITLTYYYSNKGWYSGTDDGIYLTSPKFIIGFATK